MFILKDSNGGQVSENCTYIQNPSFPSGDTSDNGITYTVSKCSNGKYIPNICVF